MMEAVYTSEELRKIDIEIPKEYWKTHKSEIHVMNYNESQFIGKLENIQELYNSGVRVVKIKFEGIDNWNRPVFKHVDSSQRYGDVNNLFSYEPNESKFKEFMKLWKEDPKKHIEYLGRSFGCEPEGGLSDKIKLEIIE